MFDSNPLHISDKIVIKHLSERKLSMLDLDPKSQCHRKNRQLMKQMPFLKNECHWNANDMSKKSNLTTITEEGQTK